MALTTINQKLAVMEWCQVWEPGLPISPGAFGQDDKQQLLWGMPTPLWGAGGPPVMPVTGKLINLMGIMDITKII